MSQSEPDTESDEDVDVAELIASDSQIYASVEDQDGVLQINPGGEKPELPTIHDIDLTSLKTELSEISSHWLVVRDTSSDIGSQYETWVPITDGENLLRPKNYNMGLYPEEYKVTIEHNTSHPVYCALAEVFHATELPLEHALFNDYSSRCQRENLPYEEENIVEINAEYPDYNKLLHKDDNWIRFDTKNAITNGSYYAPMDRCNISTFDRKIRVDIVDGGIVEAETELSVEDMLGRTLGFSRATVIPNEDVPNTDEYDCSNGIYHAEV